MNVNLYTVSSTCSVFIVPPHITSTGVRNEEDGKTETQLLPGEMLNVVRIYTDRTVFPHTEGENIYTSIERIKYDLPIAQLYSVQRNAHQYTAYYIF